MWNFSELKLIFQISHIYHLTNHLRALAIIKAPSQLIRRYALQRISGGALAVPHSAQHPLPSPTCLRTILCARLSTSPPYLNLLSPPPGPIHHTFVLLLSLSNSFVVGFFLFFTSLVASTALH